MNAKLLPRNLGRLLGGPTVVPRTRQLVFDLAVRGLLVPQRDEEGTAGSLIEDINRAPREVPLRPAYRSLIAQPVPAAPFEIPPGWAWTRLGRVSNHIQRGKSPTYSTSGGPLVVSQKCVRWEGLDLARARAITAESLATYDASRFLRDQDLLWNSTGTGTIGRVCRVQSPPPDLVCDSHVTVVRCSMLNAEYVRVWLRSDHVYGRIEGDASGSTNQVELTLQMALGMPIPLPPLAEQHRIVAKVDELMALCDELEAAQTDREARRDRLRTTSLRNLVAPDESKESARFFVQHSPRMITKPEHVAGLRGAILDLAVRGRLVPQDSREQPAAEWLALGDVNRAAVARADRRAESISQALLAAELRWAVPATWLWRGLADLALFIDYRGKTPTKVEQGVPLITAKNVRPGRINLKPTEFISDAEYDRWMTRGLPGVGDVLFTTEAPMGNAARVDLAGRFALAQRVIDLRAYGAVDADFLVLVINSRPFQLILDATATGLTAKGIKAAKLKRLPIPVPSLPEQHRIVAKVNELMAVCDELEQSLATEQTERARLLEALLRDALEDGVPARRGQLVNI